MTPTFALPVALQDRLRNIDFFGKSLGPVTSKLRDLKFAMLSCPLVPSPLAPASECVFDAMCPELGSRKLERLLFRSPPEAVALHAYGAKSSPLFLLLPHYTHLTIIRQGGLPSPDYRATRRAPAIAAIATLELAGFSDSSCLDFPWPIRSVAYAADNMGRSEENQSAKLEQTMQWRYSFCARAHEVHFSEGASTG